MYFGFSRTITKSKRLGIEFSSEGGMSMKNISEGPREAKKRTHHAA
jgi:hypothetical protein